MELKLSSNICTISSGTLLIVPYGIETRFFVTDFTFKPLLIVPYGIETRFFVTDFTFKPLLIVPYGIETVFIPSILLFIIAFNRTLWN